MAIYPSFEALKRRCADADLKIVDESALDQAEYAHIPEDDRPMPYMEIEFPMGRRTRIVEIEEEDVAEFFFTTPFERYRYMEGFEASWSSQEGVVECNLKEGSTNSLLLSNQQGHIRDGWLFDNLLHTLGIETASPHDPSLRLEVPSRTDLTTSLGPSSDVHSMLSHSLDMGWLGGEDGVTRTLTLRIEGALKAHLERQLREIEVLGDRYQDRGLLFATGTGGPINPSNLRKRSFAPLLKKARLPHIRFHDLRHTCATLLLTQGTHPKFVQELLGHATIAITLDTYSHVIPSMGDQTARAMHDALSPVEDAIT